MAKVEQDATKKPLPGNLGQDTQAEKVIRTSSPFAVRKWYGVGCVVLQPACFISNMAANVPTSRIFGDFSNRSRTLAVHAGRRWTRNVVCSSVRYRRRVLCGIPSVRERSATLSRARRLRTRTVLQQAIRPIRLRPQDDQLVAVVRGSVAGILRLLTRDVLESVVPGDGIEPPTRGSSGRRSTN